ncbi:MAG: carboxypeptidase-like regulatory domain-containing protein, partial [Sphingobacterium sp.]
MFTRQQAMLLPSLALFSAVAFAQQTEIRGRIADSGTAAPIIGASLVVKGTGQATKTNEKGEFVLQLSGNSGTLEITYVGYES